MNGPKNAFEMSGSSPGLKRNLPAKTQPALKTQPQVDFSLENHGSIFLLCPLTAPAFQWVDDHISREGFQPYWPNVVIEHRFVESVLDGITADGLVVA